MQHDNRAPASNDPPGAFTRFIRLFGDVAPDEVRDVVIMFLNVFTLLVAYYVLKTVREPLILETGGAQLKTYASGAQAATLLLYVPLYGALAARLPVNKLVMWVNIGMIAAIQFFFITGRAGLSFVGFAFYVFVGIFSLTLIAQFWSFANDIYRKSEGDRVFPVIAVGATAGAPLGAALAARLFGRGVSPWMMMEIASALLAVHTAMYAWVHRRSTRDHKETKKASANGFMMVLQSPYIRLIALLLVVQNIINTTGEYILSNLVTEQADTMAAATAGFNKGAFIGEFYGDYFLGVNILSVLVQMFVVSRLAKKFGLGGVLMALPIVALGAYGMVMSGVGIAMLRWMKTAENAADYSVMNTGKQMVWLPTTHEEKYAGKQAVDTFFVRFGDLLAAAVVFVGTHVLTFSTQQFAGINIVLVLFSIFVVYLLLKENRRVSGASTAPVPASSGRLAEARG